READHELSRKIEALLAERAPKKLYHFTDLQGILGILKSGELWCTNAQYLNDSVEVKFGLRMISNVVRAKSRLLRKRNPTGATFLDHLIMFSEAIFTNVFDVYVTCFSEDYDILSQWRGYASGCFAIEFDVAALQSLRSRPSALPPYPILQKVDYTHELQKRRIRTLLDLVIDYLPLAGTASNASDSGRNLIEIVSNVLFGLIPSFKHRSFREEREWRLVKYLQKNNPTQLGGLSYRVGQFGVTPYFSLTP